MNIVLWSGGCDSTLVLYDLAQEASASAPVRALSIDHDNVSAEKEQRRARTRILARMKRSGLPVKHTTVNISSVGPFKPVSGQGLVQPIIWLPTAVTFLGEVDDLHAGYVREDDFWHYQSQIREFFNMMQTLRGHNGALICPFEWTSKHEVISRLKKAKLLDLVWWCEFPTKASKPCGSCHECKRHYAAVQESELQESRNNLQVSLPKKVRRKK